jgi:ubiquinone/menaquinone biosynthesis C-methylase UbiE
MEKSKIVENYTNNYLRSTGNVYPTEWLIRTFRGTYPNLKFSGKNLDGKNLLEIGCGDGRNMPLFHELGAKLHGTEVSQKICEVTTQRLKNLGMNIDLKLGFNHELPFNDSMFDCVVACHSFYYVSPNTTIKNNIAEVARVMKPGGWLFMDLIGSDCFLFKDATLLEDKLYRCNKDPFGGVRDGALFQAFDGDEEIKSKLSPYFKEFAFGYQGNNFWGSQQTHHLVACQKA